MIVNDAGEHAGKMARIQIAPRCIELLSAMPRVGQAPLAAAHECYLLGTGTVKRVDWRGPGPNKRVVCLLAS